MKPMSSFFRSFVYAARGIETVWREERSFQVQVIGALCVTILMFLFELKSWEYVTIAILMAMVLVLEILNTVVERFVDMVKPRMHSYVGAIKDMMAGAVLIMSVTAAIVGAIIFFPHIAVIVIQ